MIDKMGAIYSFLYRDTGRTDDPDPITGLTSRDKYILKTTWRKLSADTVKTGMAIFLNLFEKAPEYQKQFPFRDIPRDELSENMRFRAHCVGVMYAFTSLIDSIEYPTLLEELLLKQGVAHAPRGVAPTAYWILKDVLLDLFKSVIKEEELKSWNTFLKLGFTVIIKGAESVQL